MIFNFNDTNKIRFKINLYINGILIFNFIFLTVDFIFSFNISLLHLIIISDIFLTVIRDLLKFIASIHISIREYFGIIPDVLEIFQKELYGLGPNSELLPFNDYLDSDLENLYPEWYFVYKLHIVFAVFIFFFSIVLITFNFGLSIEDKVIYILCACFFLYNFLSILNPEEYVFFERLVTFLIFIPKIRLFILFYNLGELFFDPYFTIFVYLFLVFLIIYLYFKTIYLYRLFNRNSTLFLFIYMSFILIFNFIFLSLDFIFSFNISSFNFLYLFSSIMIIIKDLIE